MMKLRSETGIRLPMWIAVILLVMDLLGTAAMLKIFPQFTIEREALLGENGRNLKEFSVSADGMLTAQSDDPWIYYAFGDPVNIRFLSVEVQETKGPHTMTQFYLMPSQGYRMTELGQGTVSMRFGLAQGCIHVGGIRLDMATDTDASLKIGNAVVNSRLSVILDFQRLFASGLALLCLTLAEVTGWRRLLLARREERSRKGNKGTSRALMAAALIQWGLKAALIWIVRKPLIDRNGIDHQHLLWWMVILSLEIFCILALHLAAGKEKKSVIWNHILILPYSLFTFALAELLNMAAFDFRTPEYLMLNLCICGLIPAVLLFLLHRPAPAFALSSIVFTVLSVANHYYGMLRDNPLEYFDIANAGTAVHVVANYTLTPDLEAVAAFLTAAVLILVVASAFGFGGYPWRARQVFINLAVLGVFSAVLFVRLPVFGNFSNMQIICMEKGYLLSFASFIKMGQIKKPEGYTPQTAGEILSAVRKDKEKLPSGGGEAGRQNYPNIIVIMNETLADMPEIYGFETDQEVLPNIHAMEENTIRGRVLVSVFGGGTANTEYEFLTGNSLYYLPVGCSPYVQYMGSRQQSLAWKLKNLGYSTAAYHPYLAVSYRRTAAYPFLGLDPFYSIESELPFQDTLRSYISDRADFKNVIHLYEERDPDAPFFLFNVTMQNHGGYSEDVPAVDVTVRPVREQLQAPAFLEYLSLIHESDSAFRELVDYFSQVEEDTIILMFGDHQPSVDEQTAGMLDQCMEARDGELDPERRYYATFVMWANFDIEEETDLVTSPNYLRSMLLDKAGVPLNAYESFLLSLREEYPAMNAFGYRNREGNWCSRGEESGELLDRYGKLMYNNIFDKKNMRTEYYE